MRLLRPEARRVAERANLCARVIGLMLEFPAMTSGKTIRPMLRREECPPGSLERSAREVGNRAARRPRPEAFWPPATAEGGVCPGR